MYRERGQGAVWLLILLILCLVAGLAVWAALHTEPGPIAWETDPPAESTVDLFVPPPAHGGAGDAVPGTPAPLLPARNPARRTLEEATGRRAGTSQIPRLNTRPNEMASSFQRVMAFGV